MIQKIKDEIERLIKNPWLDEEYNPAYQCGLRDLRSFIESLEKEQDVKFETEYVKFSNDVDADNPLPIDLADYKDFARHFYELGRNARKEK